MLHFRCPHTLHRLQSLLAVEIEQAEGRFIFLVIGFNDPVQYSAFGWNCVQPPVKWFQGKPLNWPLKPATITLSAGELKCGAPYVVCRCCNTNFPLDLLQSGFCRHFRNHVQETGLSLDTTYTGKIPGEQENPYQVTQNSLLESCVNAHLRTFVWNSDNTSHPRSTFQLHFIELEGSDEVKLRLCPYCGCLALEPTYAEHFFRFHSVFALKRSSYANEL